MPEAAKAHTKAGAKAFIVYYWQVVDYAQRTLATEDLVAVSSPECAGCIGGIRSIRHVASTGGSITGGSPTATVKRVWPLNGGAFQVDAEVMSTPETILSPGSGSKHFPGGRAVVHLTLDPTPTGWVVGDLDV